MTRMVSIIITYYTGLNILKSNIELLLQTITKEEIEIIVVNDNPTTPLSIDMLPPMDRFSLHIAVMPQNGGYAAACNYGVKTAKGDILIFMDSDILVTSIWLEQLINAYNATPDCGAVSTTILNLDESSVVHWGLGINEGIEVLKPFRDGKLPPKLQHGIYEFNMLTSGCILIPRIVFEEVGGFDEKFYNGFCDLDLTYHIKQTGYKCVVSSDAIVYHRGKVAGSTRLASEDDTRALFIKKWRENLLNDAMQILPYLYNANITFVPSSEYMLINYSRSFWASDYHAVLMTSLNAQISTNYNFKNIVSSKLILEDFLPWGLCGLNCSLIYFCDNITQLISNQHWYKHRKGKGDLIADKNGNLILTDDLLI